MPKTEFKILGVQWATGVSNTTKLNSMIHAHIYTGRIIDKTLCGKKISIACFQHDLDVLLVDCKCCLKSIKAMENKNETT